jgi:uncharacterized membrane protein YhaH (DUF805 family)
MSLGLAFKPFRDMLDFRGRSTRSEVLCFWLLGALAGLHSFLITFHWDALQVPPAIETGWQLLWTAPWFALLVRRLHDQGVGARWALARAAIPALVLIALLVWQLPSGTLTKTADGWTYHAGVGGGMAFVGLMLFGWIMAGCAMLFSGESGPNRFGPDPRAPLAEPSTRISPSAVMQ